MRIKPHCNCLAEAILFRVFAAAKDACVTESRWPDSSRNGAVRKTRTAVKAGDLLVSMQSTEGVMAGSIFTRPNLDKAEM